MIYESNVEKYFWTEAVNTACYILNRVTIRKGLNKTPYELWKDRKPNISYFHIFGCYCYILNIKDNLGKFDSKSDKGIFLGCSLTSKAYRICNLRTQTLEESMHVKFDELKINLLLKTMKKKKKKKLSLIKFKFLRKKTFHKLLPELGKWSTIILKIRSLETLKMVLKL
jgi:hypothetical protein